MGMTIQRNMESAGPGPGAKSKPMVRCPSCEHHFRFAEGGEVGEAYDGDREEMRHQSDEVDEYTGHGQRDTIEARAARRERKGAESNDSFAAQLVRRRAVRGALGRDR